MPTTTRICKICIQRRDISKSRLSRHQAIEAPGYARVQNQSSVHLLHGQHRLVTWVTVCARPQLQPRLHATSYCVGFDLAASSHVFPQDSILLYLHVATAFCSRPASLRRMPAKAPVHSITPASPQSPLRMSHTYGCCFRVAIHTARGVLRCQCRVIVLFPREANTDQ
ncbi:hypothetical protein K504DRAFT_153913 [Pleomassaria siparia CBS 279.74]|uniref:Uncharacterized protein n=1 Tax=Pleomassaria siparia CBS 279.74 TaxID=1314801 RepID=A0A6G1KNC4_9PLEO|nr:hypothetical protein K504DRAFT_153913 [Pleomassaria siparia CBS 279.74]